MLFSADDRCWHVSGPYCRTECVNEAGSHFDTSKWLYWAFILSLKGTLSLVSLLFFILFTFNPPFSACAPLSYYSSWIMDSFFFFFLTTYFISKFVFRLCFKYIGHSLNYPGDDTGIFWQVGSVQGWIVSLSAVLFSCHVPTSPLSLSHNISVQR